MKELEKNYNDTLAQEKEIFEQKLIAEKNKVDELEITQKDLLDDINKLNTKIIELEQTLMRNKIIHNVLSEEDFDKMTYIIIKNLETLQLPIHTIIEVIIYYLNIFSQY
jgi:hypothetical protein